MQWKLRLFEPREPQPSGGGGSLMLPSAGCDRKDDLMPVERIE